MTVHDRWGSVLVHQTPSRVFICYDKLFWMLWWLFGILNRCVLFFHVVWAFLGWQLHVYQIKKARNAHLSPIRNLSKYLVLCCVGIFLRIYYDRNRKPLHIPGGFWNYISQNSPERKLIELKLATWRVFRLPNTILYICFTHPSHIPDLRHGL